MIGDTNFDSLEEKYFVWFIEELVALGYVRNIIHEPQSFLLSDKVTYKYDKKLKTKTVTTEGFLMHDHIYTPDFGIVWDTEAEGIFVSTLNDSVKINTPFIAYKRNNKGFLISLIEIKPHYDQNNMTRLFRINQKWMYEKFKIYVQEIVPEKLFKDTFTPFRYTFTDSGRQGRKIKFKVKLLKEFLNNRC